MSEAYRRWKREAGLTLLSQRPKKVLGKVSVSVQLCAPDKRRRDADNAGTKALLDLLVAHQIIEADDNRFLKEIKVAWVENAPPCLVTIQSI